MKKLLLSIPLTLIAATSFGQPFGFISFDNSPDPRIIIDTVANPNNIWQIGHPNKTIFTTAYSSPNVIATDTLNPYPINDTSSFTIIHIADLGWYWQYYIIYIDGWYSVNSDTLTDRGYIEFSPDHGNTWFYADSIMNHGCCFSGSEELPTFTGNSFGWQHFHYCLCAPISVNIGDTVLYRFTFISDSVQTNKDGLMFDNLEFMDMIEGVDEIQNDNLISISPNPATSELKIQNAELKIKEIEIYSVVGEKVYQERLTSDIGHRTISVADFPSGMYFVKVFDGEKYYCRKLMVGRE